MKRRAVKTRQYTIRNVPEEVDRALRKQAMTAGKTLNETALEALRRAARGETPARYHDLDHLIGKWVEDPEFDRAIAEQDVIDEDLWR